MSLFSLITVFLLEQLRPLDYSRWVADPFLAWADFLERRFNAGSYRQGMLVWCLAVLPPLLLVGGFISCSTVFIPSWPGASMWRCCT